MIGYLFAKGFALFILVSVNSMYAYLQLSILGYNKQPCRSTEQTPSYIRVRRLAMKTSTSNIMC